MLSRRQQPKGSFTWVKHFIETNDNDRHGGELVLLCTCGLLHHAIDLALSMLSSYASTSSSIV